MRYPIRSALITITAAMLLGSGAALAEINACKADLNGDLVVNFADLAVLKSVFFQRCDPGPTCDLTLPYHGTASAPDQSAFGVDNTYTGPAYSSGINVAGQDDAIFARGRSPSGHAVRGFVDGGQAIAIVAANTFGGSTSDIPYDSARGGGMLAYTKSGEYGIWAQSDSVGGRGVAGVATQLDAIGVKGASFLGDGVVGEALSADGIGVHGIGAIGVRGTSSNGYAGVFGVSEKADGAGVSGWSYGADGIGVNGTAANIGVRGSGVNVGVLGVSTGLAGKFIGSVLVDGALTANGIYAHGEPGSAFPAASFTHDTTVSGTKIRNSGGGPALEVSTSLNSGGLGIWIHSDGDSIHATGRIEASGFQGSCSLPACNSDLAETFRNVEATEPGDLVALVETEETDPTVRKATRAYDRRLIGVVSTNPGLVFDQGKTRLAGDNSNLTTPEKAVVAAVGRVPTKVSMENGAIAVGDAITSSSEPGVGMRATKVGKIVGYALERAVEDGKILVWIEPGHYLPPEVEDRLNELLAVRGGL